MTVLTEEQVERLCDFYCRFPYAVEGDDLCGICEKCPLSVADQNEGRQEDKG